MANRITKSSGWEALKNRYSEEKEEKEEKKAPASSGWEALKQTYTNSQPQATTPAPSTQGSWMDQAINTLKERVSNSSLGEWANRVSNNVQQVWNETPAERTAKKATQNAAAARRKQWEMDNAQLIDEASSKYEGPTLTERRTGTTYDTSGSDLFSNDWEPAKRQTYETERTVRNERYNPLSREERDNLINTWNKAVNGKITADEYQNLLYNVTKNGGIEQLYREQQADAENDREYGRQLRGVDLSDMSVLERIGGTLGGIGSAAGKQIGSSGVGIMASDLNRTAEMASRDDTLTSYKAALEQAARAWYNGLLNGADYQETEDAVRQLATYVGGEDYAEAIVNRVRERAENSNGDDLTTDLLTDIAPDENKIWENSQKAIADAGIYDAINKLNQGAQEDIQYAKDVNLLQNKFGDNMIEAGVSTIQNMADAALAATLGLSGTGVVAMIPFALRAYGGTYAEQMQQATDLGQMVGRDVAKQAAKTAGMSSAIEVGTEMMWGMVGAMSKVTGGGALDDAAQQKLTEILSGWAKTETGRKILTTIGEKALGGITEGLEEVIGDAAEQILKNAGIMSGEAMEWSDWVKEAGHSFATGALAGLIGETTSIVSTPLQRANLGNQLRNGALDITVDELIDLANAEGMENTSLAHAYSDLFHGLPRNTENLSDQELGKLYESYQETLGKRDAAYDAISAAKEKVEAGEELTRAEVNRITNNSDAVAILTENGTVNEEAFHGEINERREAVSMALEAFANDSMAAEQTQAENVQAETQNASTPILQRQAEYNAIMSAARDMQRRQMLSPAESIRANTSDRILTQNVARSIYSVADAAERLGVSPRAQDVMSRMYDPRQDTVEYAGEMTKYYNQGKAGNELDISGIQNVSAQQAQAAYNSGRMEMIEEEYRNGSEGTELRVRSGVQGNDSQSAGGQSQRVEGGTGSAEFREEIAGYRGGRQITGVHPESVSAADLGIAGGSTNRNIHLVEARSQDVMKAKAIIEGRGLNFVAFSGGALEVNGVQARGYYDPSTNTVYVRADHRIFTAEQLARHEAMHDSINKGEISLADTRDVMIDKLGEDKFYETVDGYAALYQGTGLSESEIFEEMICDAAGNMNEFIYRGHFEDAVKAVPTMQAAKESAEKVRSEGKGPAGNQQKYSPDIGIPTVVITPNAALAKRLEGVSRSERYRILYQYLQDTYVGQVFHMSDGIEATMDGKDANKLKYNADENRVAVIGDLKNVVESAKYFAKDDNPTHPKFDAFRYYAVNVKIGTDEDQLNINVGRTRNDKDWHIYDINNLSEKQKEAIAHSLGTVGVSGLADQAHSTRNEAKASMDNVAEENGSVKQKSDAYLPKTVSEERSRYDGSNSMYAIDPNGRKYSLDSLGKDIVDRKFQSDLVNKLGWTTSRVDQLVASLNDLMEYIKPNRDILDLNEEYTKETRPYSPYKPNSDPLYKISLDYSTLCRKRLMTQYIIEKLQLREHRPMSGEEQIAIRDMLKEYRQIESGLQVACAMCYVEAARLKSPDQMNRYFEDPTPVLKNYFAQKNKAYKRKVENLQKKWKTDHGYDANATKKEMTPADVSAFNEYSSKIRHDYDPATDQSDAKRRKEELDAIERAKGLSPDNYLSAANLADLKAKDQLIYDAYTSNIRAATRSKGLETDVPYYYGDSRRKGGPSDKFISNVNAENGMRFSSWSDFQFTHLLDQMMATIDLSVRKAAMHGYTKFPEQVRIFGKTGAMFNMSGVSGGTGFNADGSLYFSPTESIDFEEAKRLREEFPETAGLQCIGINDKHVRALLQSDFIDYVIPYHVSGMNAALRNMAKISSWKDYTSTQEESVINSKEEWDPSKNCPKDKWHKAPVFSEFFDPSWYTDPAYKGKGVKAMQEAAKRYVQMCADRGMRPKFTQFMNEANYWKLLIDRKMVNQKTGDLIRQRPVTPDFDFDVIKNEINTYVENYRKSQGIEDRALKYITDNLDQLPGRIAALKQEGAVEKTIAKAEQLGNEMYASAPRNVAAYKYSRDLDAESNFNALYTTLEDGRIKPNNVEDLSTEDWKLIYKAVNKLGYGLESAKQAKEVYSRYVGQGGFNKEQSEAIKKAYGVSEDGGVAANPKREALARKTFGTTGDFREAGYLMRNGSMLDFSGKKDGGPAHVRYMDHREISSVFGDNEIPEDKRRYGDNSAYMNAFISEGNIRLMDGQGVTIGEMEPTAQQYTMLKQFIDRVMKNEDYFYLDLSNNDGYTVASRDYEGRDGSAKVIRDIKEYFKNGELPYRSSLSQFYSRDLDSMMPDNADETARKVVDNLSRKAKLNDLAAKYGSFKSTAYTDERIAREIDYSYATGERSKDYARAYITFVNPKDFIDATSAGSWRGNLYQEVEDKAKAEGRESMLDLDALQNERQSMFLRIEATEDGRASIVGHEGRHRMIGLEKEGYKYVPVIIEPREGSYPDGQSRYSTKPIDMLWLNGQEFGSGKGASFVLHDILPLSANYADIAKEIFAGGQNVTKFSRDLANTELYDANRQLQKDVTELRRQLKTRTEQKEYWKGQTKVTQGRKLRTDDVTKLARDIIKGQESNVDAKSVAEKMKALGEYILNSQDENVYDEARLKAYEVAHDILSNAKVLNTKGGEDFYSDFRTALKSQPIYVAPSVREEVAPDGWNDFRKAQFGTVNMTADQSKGKSVDKVYHDLQATFGEWLLPEYITSEADQLNKILEVIETYRPVYENLNSYEMADAVEWTANEILTRIIGNEIRETNPTYADRMEKKLADQKMKTQDALRKVRANRDQKVASLKAHYQQMAEDRRNRKIDSEARTRLLNIAKRLNNKKLPRVTRALLDQYIGDLDLVSKGILGRTVKELETLQAWYDSYKESMGDDFIPDKFIERKIARLSKKHISDLTQEEVSDLTTVLLNIENMIRTENELIESKIKMDTYAAGVQTIDDINNSNGKTGFLNKYISTETATPEREVNRITGYRENSPLYMAAKELSDGQRKMLDYQRRAEALFKKWTTDKAFIKRIAGKKAEAITVQGIVDGKTTNVVITPAMRMALYLHSKNDDNMRHIAKGGVKIPNMSLYVKGKLQEAYDKATRVVFTRGMINEIASHMTDKERAFADAVDAYYNGMSRDSLNDVSELLRGYAIAGVEHYYPIDTDGSFLKKEFDAIKRDGSIEGMGMLKERIEGASNPIMLYDINDTLNRSISQHSKYYGLAIPVRNFNRLYGVTTHNYETSVAETLKKNWGSAATSYIEKMMADVQNGTGMKSDAWGDLLARARSHYAGAVLNTNASVAMKQSASYPTAAAVVGYGPLMKALADTQKIDLNKLAEYTPLLWYRSKGFSTTELGDIGKEGGHIPKALNWIQAIDVATTTKLAKAAMYYVNENNNLTRGTDAWWKAVAEVYNRIIEETQPNYTMMQRPQILRSDNALTRALNMFKTQPFQNFNILYDAFGNLAAKTRENKANPTQENEKALKQARTGVARAVSSQAVSAFVFALMQFAWDAFRGKAKKYKDDDEEMTLASWMKGMGINVLSSAGGMIPFGSYVLELGEALTDAILKGFKKNPVFDQTFYGLSENAAESMNDMGNALLSIVNKVSKALQGEATTESTIRSLVDSMGDIAQFAGIPVNNVIKLAQSLARNVFLATDGKYLGGFEALRVTTDPSKYKSDYYDLLKKAWLNDPTAFEEIRKRMIDMAGDPFATSSKTAEENIDAKIKEWKKEKAPTEALYQNTMNALQSSNLWDMATQKQQEKVMDNLLSLAVGDEKMTETVEGGKAVGLDATEYMLYKLALQMADEDGNGSIKQSEAEAAVNMIPGLSNEEKAYLFQSTNSSWKKNPFDVTRGGSIPSQTVSRWARTPNPFEIGGDIFTTGPGLYNGYGVSMTGKLSEKRKQLEASTGADFYRAMYGEGSQGSLSRLEEIVSNRANDFTGGSYTMDAYDRLIASLAQLLGDARFSGKNDKAEYYESMLASLENMDEAEREEFTRYLRSLGF